jgi:hypothetical protein
MALLAMREAEVVASLLARNRLDKLLAQELGRTPKRLAAYGFKAFSQSDEDGIIQEIFCRIGTTSKCFIEIGCGDGLENNTHLLLLSGWTGLWVDGSPQSVAAARRYHAGAILRGSLTAHCCTITTENVDQTLSSLCRVEEVDLLSIDIDGNDYWIWSALSCVRPRVVVIEYNAALRPPLSLVQSYRSNAQWDHTNFFGAGLAALEKLAASKGYSLVGCNLAGVNAFFVRNDCLHETFSGPFTAHSQYMPPNYDLFAHTLRHAHPPGAGDYVNV